MTERRDKTTDRARFERLVEEALAGLPKTFKKHMENIAVMVETRPSPRTLREMRTGPGGTLLGLYHGVPLHYRGSYYGNTPPDVIVIYQEPIEEICRTDEEIKLKVREVVLHEVGHFFGMTDRELRAIEGDDEW
ncbi:MAG: metallopeptidase family protein [Candidatus Aminicenantes bacterium]|nr:metallopeptidase family protein [Candidatus Aminicenantes bacterium]